MSQFETTDGVGTPPTFPESSFPKSSYPYIFGRSIFRRLEQEEVIEQIANRVLAGLREDRARAEILIDYRRLTAEWNRRNRR